MKQHANVAIFVPHAGCKHGCIFCDQREISGTAAIPRDAVLIGQLQSALESLGKRAQNGGIDAQIAFFGGSFTAIARSEMVRLLRIVQPFLGKGAFSGIRISTRPDAIDEEVLAILAAYGVSAIELGAQSMEDAVLFKSKRGHTSADVKKAAALIHAHGFSLGLQMMTGLPGDTDAGALRTAQSLVDLAPATMRIYPTLVLKGTALAALWQQGHYTPQTLEEAVHQCGALLAFFTDNTVPVIRLGLHDTPSLKQGLLAGPYHPAFRELCEGEVMYCRASDALKDMPPGEVVLGVAQGAVSKMAGQRKTNILALNKRGYHAKIRECRDIAYLQVQVMQSERK